MIGRDALLGYIADSHAEMPGLVVSDTTTPKMLDGRMFVHWIAAQGDEQRFSGGGCGRVA